MEDLIWSWDQWFEGTVPNGEHPIVTLAKAGFVFTKEEDGTVGLNHVKESVSSDGMQKRRIYIQIQVVDEVSNRERNTH